MDLAVPQGTLNVTRQGGAGQRLEGTGQPETGRQRFAGVDTLSPKLAF